LKQSGQALSTELLQQLKAVVGDNGWLDDSVDLSAYLTEWRGLFSGSTPLVLRPTDTAQVSAILKLCNEHGVGVVPQGGNTGLAGGAIPGLNDSAEIVLSLERMNQIVALDAANFTMTVQAGCVLENLQQSADEADRLFPLSLASEGSCQIGGNISTNAGGTAVLRYGNTRDLVLGLEVVLPDGSVISELNGVRKDNTGYDLKQLFIGAEGTLGVVTAATLKLFPKPLGVTTALIGLESMESVVAFFGAARNALGDEILAFETFPELAMQMVCSHISGCRNPFDSDYPWYVLVELASQNAQEHVDSQLMGLLEAALEKQQILDGVVAQSVSQRDDFWKLRHGISEAQKHAGGSIKHDISVPVSRMPEFVFKASVLAGSIVQGVRPVPFGHVGDGNIHFNLSQPEGMDKQAFLDTWEVMNESIHGLAVEMGGSFSAEHGIGSLKRNELARLTSDSSLSLMRSVKAAVDPNGIMNPGKLL